VNFSEIKPISSVVLLAVLLSACGAAPKKGAPVQPSAATLASEAEQAKIAREQRRQKTIVSLLDQAEKALKEDKLTTPTSDNAVDRYRAVLLLSPNDARAQAGIRNVGQRYCQLAHVAIGQGEFNTANAMLAKAREIAPNLPAIGPLQKQLAEAQRQRRQQQPAEPVQLVAETDVVKLPQAELSKRSESLVTALETLAQRVKAEDSYVLIIARSDAEGRWVYQQMKEALPGYLLRGNIELGNDPKIILQAPL